MADRLASLGVAAGTLAKRFHGTQLAAALRTSISDDMLRDRARRLGKAVRTRDGVGAAATILERSVEGPVVQAA